MPQISQSTQPPKSPTLFGFNPTLRVIRHSDDNSITETVLAFIRAQVKIISDDLQARNVLAGTTLYVRAVTLTPFMNKKGSEKLDSLITEVIALINKLTLHNTEQAEIVLHKLINRVIDLGNLPPPSTTVVSVMVNCLLGKLEVAAEHYSRKHHSPQPTA